ncbi:amidohydrolase [Glaciihabitans sp. UYNi722]|uniref:amidohydrolase n=1 Tax=Glaciihabitans sp. UYNi722 TaxID=3156344 RepID=UPI00339384DF
MRANTILRNGRIVAFDPELPTATTIAIAGGRIVAVGDDQIVSEMGGPDTVTVDLEGRSVTPGLIDAHVHPAFGVERTIGADLAGVTRPDDLLSRLRAEADATPPGAWVRAFNLSYAVFASMPMRADAIDSAVNGRPAAVFLFDGHTMLVSHAALAEAGISGAQSFPDTSEIVVDDSGCATGQLREESAIALILNAAPRPSEREIRNQVSEVYRKMAAVGLTGLCVMDGDRTSFDRLDAMDRQGTLPLRIVTALDHAPGQRNRLPERMAMRDECGARWRGGVIKLYADGVIDTGTGWLYEPDTFGDGGYGLWNDPAEFREVVRDYAAAGFQLAVHAIGDRAIGETIDAFLATGVRSVRGAPHRLEHLESLSDNDLRRIGDAGITASMQPAHLQWSKPDNSDAWGLRLGHKRASRGWRAGDVSRAGIPLALGSDWPVAQFDPRIVMAWARLRRTPGDRNAPVIVGDQRLSALTALKAYTRGAALAQGDDDLGEIAVGYRADLAIWDKNPVEVDADDLVDVGIHATLIDGITTGPAVDAEIDRTRRLP